MQSRCSRRVLLHGSELRLQKLEATKYKLDLQGVPYEDWIWILITALSESWTFSYLGSRVIERQNSLKRTSVLRVKYDVKRKKIHLKHKLRQEWGRNKRTCSSALEQRQN